MKLSGNTIAITGGATGLGLALAEEFLSLGNEVIICGRRTSKLTESKMKFPALHTYICDVGKSSERINLVNKLTVEHPQLNVFINNAGIQQYLNLKKEVSQEQIESELKINVEAPIHFNTLLFPFFSNKDHSAIINVTSGLAFSPLALVPIYCATKAALHSYTLSLRHQLRDTSIEVIEIAPPIVDTALGGTGRDDNNVTHRGISPKEFAVMAMEGLKQGKTEVLVSQAAAIREKGEAMFPLMNK